MPPTHLEEAQTCESQLYEFGSFTALSLCLKREHSSPVRRLSVYAPAQMRRPAALL